LHLEVKVMQNRLSSKIMDCMGMERWRVPAVIQ